MAREMSELREERANLLAEIVALRHERAALKHERAAVEGDENTLPAESQVRSRDDFARLVHDLRSPLAALRFAVQVLRSDASDAAVVERSAARIEGQIQSLAEMVDALLPGSSRADPPLESTFDSPPGADDGHNRAASHRVLIVEDSNDTARSLAILLRLAGHEVQVASSGPAALEASTQFDPQVVLLDLGLPGMDGFELARQLRRLPSTSHALLVAISGRGQPSDRQRAAEAGIDDFLVKPADPAAIRERLARWRGRA